MQFWVYLLRCSDGSYYAGHTDNLEGRLWQHQRGICCDWTSRRRPVELVWCGAAPTRDEAITFERRIKGWTRAKKEALIAGDWDRIGWLARPPHERPTVRPERRPKAVVEGRLAPPSGERPSTSLRTNEVEASPEHFVRAERSAERAVEARTAQSPEQRPSTSLRTNEIAAGTNDSVRAERSAERVVEARTAQPSEQRPSTSLRTNEVGDPNATPVPPEQSAKRVVEGRTPAP